jgi:hypothetical protein
MHSRSGAGRTAGTVDSEQEVGGYPVQLASHQAFDPTQWDLRYMTPKVAFKYKAIH